MILVAILIFLIATLMTMVGKGGGNFYVVVLALAKVPMHQAATTGQFILFTASATAMLLFQRRKSLSWPLAILIGSLTSAAAFGRGYLSHAFSDFFLKLLFAAFLFLTGMLMLLPPPQLPQPTQHRPFWILTIRSGQETYRVNLSLVLPATLLTGFAAGMVGVSGGSFLVPLLVLACGVPMQLAVGTASSLIAVTALMGFTGHALQGDFRPSLAIPLALAASLGGIVGAHFALKSKPAHLKRLFAYTNWLAALFMILNALHKKGIL